MPSEIRQVAVIGSGVMGSQIAAQVANAGVPVMLLDIVPEGATDKNVLAQKALERLAGSGAFMSAAAQKLVTPGNLDDDLQKLKECDWILEAIIENLQIKSDLYKKVDAVRKPGAIVASNTSTIPLAKLIEGQSSAFAKDFMITHFFNPVRFMRLLELITGPQTDPASRELMAKFCDEKLGKGVVPCNDTPGFIANRLGMFWLQSAVNAAMDLGLTVEEADAVCGKPMGVPRTGVFGLIDLIGLDLMPLIGKSLLSTLGPNDAYRGLYQEPELFQKMIADGYTGRKGKGGYYRIVKNESGKVTESINLETGDYAVSVPAKSPTLDMGVKDLRGMCEATDKIGQYAWRVLSETLSYAFLLVPGTVPDITLADDGMRMGYAWGMGPFELIDKLGTEWFANKLKSEGRSVPDFLQKAAGKTFYRVNAGKKEFLQLDGTYAPIKRAPGILLLSDIKLASKPVDKNDSAALWDVGDGVLCLEFTTKANAIGSDTLTMIHKAIKLIGDGKGAWKGLVVYSEAGNFSAGANLSHFRGAIKSDSYLFLDTIIKQGQEAYSALRFAPFPSVAAPAGFAMGGGCEITLHCSAVQSYCELTIGLVEVGVGLIPGWGGCTQMIGRHSASKAYELIMSAKTSKSAADAKDLGLLRPTDGITMNRERLLFDAKQKVLQLAAGYAPPQPMTLSLPGFSGKSGLEAILTGVNPSPYDATIGKMLAGALCGEDGNPTGSVTEAQMMDIERKLFVKLCHQPETLARIDHMLEKGKPLKN